MKEQIKELRVKIDGLYQLTKELTTYQIPFAIKVNNDFQFTEEQLTLIKQQPVMVLVEEGIRPTTTIIKTKEIEDAYGSLRLAKAWLGEVLEELGETKETINIAQNGIPYTTHAAITKDYLSKEYVEKVDWLRTEIEKVINEVKQIGNAPNPPMLNREISIARTNAYNHLCEAHFALGFELERIKENN